MNSGGIVLLALGTFILILAYTGKASEVWSVLTSN